MSAEREFQIMFDLARHSLDVASESEWWESMAAAVTGPLFAALVMTVNVVNAREMYGWFSVVHPKPARRRIPLGSPMDTILTTDHPFSVHLREHVVTDPIQVTDLVSERQWRRLPSYARMRELTDGAHHMVLNLPRDAPYLESVSIVRADRAFDEAEMARAAQLQTVMQLAVGQLRHVADRERRWGPLREREAASAAVALGVTARERVVLELLADGLSTRGLGRRLHIAPRTVDKHKQNIYRKLQTADRVATVVRARRLGLLPDQPVDPGLAVRPSPGLTPREASVLDLLATGMTNTAIGDALGLRVGTVNVHVGNVLTKLDARTRTEAVAVAYRNRYVR